jgi:broad specificity phosphatase PhoE
MIASTAGRNGANVRRSPISSTNRLCRKRRQRREHGPHAQRHQRELHPRLGARLQRGEVAVDPARDVGGWDGLGAAVDQHLGERDEPEERDRVQVAQAVRRADRGGPPPREPGDEHQVDAHPAEQERGARQAVHVGGAAPDERGRLADHERDIAAGDHQGHPAPAPYVGRAERRDQHEQHVLGERVRHVRGDPRVAVDDVAHGQQRAQNRVPDQQPAQPPFRRCQLVRHGSTVSERRLPRVTVFLVRHGETEWAATGRHTSVTDVPLLESGRRDAELLRRRLERHQFALVLTSPRARARDTAELAGLGDVLEVDEDLVEVDYGEYEGLTTPEIRERVPGWTVWEHGSPGGESVDDVGVRADRVIERALAAEGDVALFAHGHLLRILGARWIGLPAEAGGRLALSTAALCVLGYERERRVLWGWNDQSASSSSSGA